MCDGRQAEGGGGGGGSSFTYEVMTLRLILLRGREDIGQDRRLEMKKQEFQIDCKHDIIPFGNQDSSLCPGVGIEPRALH